MEKSIYNKDYRAVLGWLRDRRKESGLTMREVGLRLGIHHSWVARIEQGDRRLDLAEYVLLCGAIGCNPHDGLTLLVQAPVQKPVLKAADNSPTWRKSKSR